MEEFEIFCSGCLFGTVTIGAIMTRLHLGFIKRFYEHVQLEDLTQELETRRATYDSEEGEAIDEGGLFETRPGAMYLAQLATKLPENRWKTFDTGHISATMSDVGVESDQGNTPE
jgi:hypothetical protein